MGEKFNELACGSNADAADTPESNVERNMRNILPFKSYGEPKNLKLLQNTYNSYVFENLLFLAIG